MRRIFASLILFSATVVVLPLTAWAAPITIQVTGTVFTVDTNDGLFANPISVGDPFSAIYTYESTLPDTNADPTLGVYDYATGPGFGMTTTINGMVFQTITDVSAANRIEVFADNPFNDDRYALWNSSNQPYNGNIVYLQRLQMYDGTKTANSSDALPSTAPNLNAFNTIFFDVILRNQAFALDSFGGDITSITVVPEPSSLVLCGLGAIGLFIAARRRKT